MSSTRNHRKSNSSGYDRWSSFYDTYLNPTVAMDELTFPALWGRLRGKHVLEIGCGTGRHTRKLISARNTVVGLDLSAGMLAVARTKLKNVAVEFIQADFMAYDGLPMNHFDAALSSLVVEHIEDLPMFYSRVAKTLKTEGDLFISEIHPNRAAKGTFAHFRDIETQEEIHIESHAHTSEQMEAAAGAAHLTLLNKEDVCGNEALAALNVAWSRYLGQPMIQLWHFRKR